MDRRGAALHVLFFVSGALGLVYEVLWMRELTWLFGATTLATTAVLSAFFLGTAVGSAVLGARSRGWARPLVTFGVLEIGVGLSALLAGPILSFYTSFYSSLYGSFAGRPAVFAAAKLLLAMLAVGLPTFLMGGTLPALARVGAGPAGLGIRAGGLYAMNVLGAMVGALLVPFALLPALGAAGAYRAAVLGSVVVGGTAALLGSRGPRRPIEGPAAGTRPPIPASILLLAGWSGACTLGLQVLWTRMFSLVHESSVYSFAVVVALFLGGLAGGAALARTALRRKAPARLWLARAWSLAGLLIVISPVLFHELTRGLAHLPEGDWLAGLRHLVGLGTLTLLPASVALGAALPLLMEMAGASGDDAGPTLGRLLSVNTLGAVLGPLAVTYALAPAVGLWTSLAWVGGATVIAGILSGLPRGERLTAGVLLAVLLLVAGPTRLPPVRVRAAEGERVVSVREGSYGTTAVLDDGDDRWITVNNSYVLGGSGAAAEERWQGHLPLLLHPAPRRVAFVGVGTGITASPARLYPAEEIVALEIVPDVLEAARQDFAFANGRLLDDPRVRAVVDDGRHHLAATTGERPFDVIVGDLLVPWRPGEAGLFTREYLQTVRRALAPDGLFCQWLPAYQLSEAQLVILARTFADVFPNATVWRGNFVAAEPVIGLVGHGRAAPLDAAAIDARLRALPASARSESPFLGHPAGLWLFLVGSLDPAAPWVAGARLNTDDQPWIELLSPRVRERLTGAAFQAFAERFASGRLAGPLDGLDEAHEGWRQGGRALAAASAGGDREGEAKVLAILQTLPIELQRSLGVVPPDLP
jgi:spermidine synthase